MPPSMDYAKFQRRCRLVAPRPDENDAIQIFKNNFHSAIGTAHQTMCKQHWNIRMGFEKPVHRGAYKKFTSHIQIFVCSACLPVGFACRARLSCPPAVPARCTPCRARLPCLPALPACLPCRFRACLLCLQCLSAMPACSACQHSLVPTCLSICVSIFLEVTELTDSTNFQSELGSNRKYQQSEFIWHNR
jgi:hypothetical protein